MQEDVAQEVIYRSGGVSLSMRFLRYSSSSSYKIQQQLHCIASYSSYKTVTAVSVARYNVTATFTVTDIRSIRLQLQIHYS